MKKENWEVKRLGNVCHFVGGGTPSKSNNSYYCGNIPWATVADMQHFELKKTGFLITADAVKESATNIIPKSTLIIATRVGLGKVCILMQDTAINQDLKGVFPDNNLNKFYLAYWFKNKADEIIYNGKGATVKGVTLDYINNLLIQIPPLPIQEQIVKELNTISDIIAKKKTLLAELDTLAQASFYDMFGDPVDNDKGWETGRLVDVAPIMASKKDITPINNKYWLLNLDMIESITGKIIDLKFENLENIGSSTYKFDSDNVLYAKLRPYLNKVTIPEMAGYATTELVPLRPDVNRINKIFLSSLLRCQIFVDYIKEKVTGAKMPRTDMTAFRNFMLILPPLPLQTQFAQRIEAIEQQKALIQQSIDDVQQLFDYTMDKYFN